MYLRIFDGAADLFGYCTVTTTVVVLFRVAETPRHILHGSHDHQSGFRLRQLKELEKPTPVLHCTRDSPSHVAALTNACTCFWFAFKPAVHHQCACCAAFEKKEVPDGKDFKHSNLKQVSKRVQVSTHPTTSHTKRPSRHFVLIKLDSCCQSQPCGNA